MKGELIEAINETGLHYADLVALRDAVRILAGDHDGARWVCAQTRQLGDEYLALRMGKGGAGGK